MWRFSGFRQMRWRTPAATFRIFFFNGSPNGPGGESFFNGGLRGRGRFFSMVRPTGPGGVSDFFFQWSAQRAREEFRFFFSMVRPTGPGGFRFFNGPPFRFSMVRPTGPGGVSDFFFQWSAQRAREKFRIFFSPTGPGGVSFFNGPPNGPGRSFGFFFNGPPNGPGRSFGFFFQWSAQRPRRGFVFQWFAQRVCGVGVGFFSMVRPTGPGGVSDFFFSMVRPTGPGGVSDFFFQWSAQRAREGFRF